MAWGGEREQAREGSGVCVCVTPPSRIVSPCVTLIARERDSLSRSRGARRERSGPPIAPAAWHYHYITAFR